MDLEESSHVQATQEVQQETWPIMLVARDEDFLWSKIWDQIKTETVTAGMGGVTRPQLLGLYVGSYLQGILEQCRKAAVRRAIQRTELDRSIERLEVHMKTRLLRIMGVTEIPERESFITEEVRISNKLQLRVQSLIALLYHTIEDSKIT